VIAAGAGGALETVLDGQTGLLAVLDDPNSFAEAMRRIEHLDLDPADARENAERFSVAAFQRRLHERIEAVLAERAPSRA
jgi:glycosyltransferase involved in cell wall biosynthesis